MRTLAAALACRVQGTRLYGKPLQALDPATGVTILSQIAATIQHLPVIDSIVLGIAEGVENTPFARVAERIGLQHVWGDERDVLQRLIDCGRAANATDVFRVTTECPFIYHEAVATAWASHTSNGNDVTVIDGLPDGTFFEIYRLSALEASHERGDERDRSELCSRYIVNHRDEFQVQVLEPPDRLQRQDLRLTVDNPEDLVVCRRIYHALRDRAPLIPLAAIIAYLDAHPELVALVAPFHTPGRVWQ